MTRSVARLLSACLALVVGVVVIVAAGFGSEPPDRSRPNLVVIYTDDQGYGDCRALNPECGFPTPNLDRLAREGMTFTDGHSASGVCTPSRYALLTGRYAWRTRLKRGVLRADEDALIDAGRWTLASMLREYGYSTAAFGKWHLGLQIPGEKGSRDWSARVPDGPLQRGFDRFYGIPASMNFGVLTWFDGDRATEPASMWTRKKFPPSEIVTRPLDYRMAPPFDAEPQHARDVEVAPSFVDGEALRITTKKTVEFLESRGDAPFFVYVALTSPHLPHCTAPEFRGLSGMGNYGDFMLETDHRVGEILDALQRTGAADNTIVVFTSDNGPENNYKDWIARYGHHANGGWRGGKRDLYEGGHRVPFFVRWPGVVEAGSRSDALVGQVDLLATVAELVGVEPPEDQAEDSLSFAGVLHGREGKRESLVHHSGAGHFGYRSGDWKLVFLPPARGTLCELYDLAADPGERHDVSEAHPEVVRRLTDELGRVVEGERNDGPATWPQLTWMEVRREPKRVIYKTVGDVELRLDIFEPAGHRPSDARPAAVFFFGGGWVTGNTDQFEPHARYLASRGMVGITADYRVRNRHGTTPFECVADGKSAIRWVRTHAARLGIDPDRIAAGGGSAGGHVAAAAGVVPGLEEAGEDEQVGSRPDALLLFNPVFDNGPDGYGHELVMERYREISPLHNISRGAPPTVVFLGTEDQHIPVATAKAYEAKMAAVGSRCDLHLYDGQPHGFFNHGKSPRHYVLTVVAMDEFLASMGWLEGKPTLREPERPAVDCIDPMIGAVTYLAETKDAHGLGKTFPGAAWPFGLVQLSPDTITGGDNGSGYSYEHPTIEGFSFTHMSGVGWYGDLGNFLVTPTTGELQTNRGKPDDPESGYRSRFTHEGEVAEAGYYAVSLTDHDVRAELTVSPRAGILRFTFPKHEQSRIQIDLSRRVGGTSTEQYVKVVDEHTICGWMKCPPEGGGWGNGHGKADYTVHFYCQFSKPLETYGIWSADIPEGQRRLRQDVQSDAYQQRVADAEVFPGRREAQGKHLGFFTEFETTENEPVLVKCGISFVSIDGARENLRQTVPCWDFDVVRSNSRARWAAAVANVDVQGGTEEDRTKFYTALYHTMIDPRAVSDVTGEYIGADREIHETVDFTYRSIFSGWDVFRSQFPLQTIINPRMVNDEVNSLLQLAELSGKGYFPRWEMLNAYSGCMLGNPGVSVVVDAYQKGIRDYDIDKAFTYCRNSVDTFGNGERGFAPRSLSRTLEYAYSDWCVGRFAESLGKIDVAERYYARSQAYRNVWDDEVRWFRSRDEEGEWLPWKGKTVYGQGAIESNPFQQGWFVPHDVPGLIELMGRELFVQELVSFFENTPDDFTWNEYYNHANEPVHQVPFLFNEVGMPWLTQRWTRKICSDAYGADRYGICGNEDVGQMSAWYVLAAMGIHPICPGDNRYQITSPVFDRITLKLDAKYYGGKSFSIVAKNNSPKNVYIQSLELNGKALDRFWLSHREITAGGTLEMEMGPEPAIPAKPR